MQVLNGQLLIMLIDLLLFHLESLNLVVVLVFMVRCGGGGGEEVNIFYKKMSQLLSIYNDKHSNDGREYCARGCVLSHLAMGSSPALPNLSALETMTDQLC